MLGAFSETKGRKEAQHLACKIVEQFVPAQWRIHLELKQLGVALDERGVSFTREKLRMAKNIEEEGDVGADAADEKLVEATLHLDDCRRKVSAFCNEFAEHGVIIGVDCIPGAEGAIHADARAAWDGVGLDAPSIRLRFRARQSSGSQAAPQGRPAAP